MRGGCWPGLNGPAERNLLSWEDDLPGMPWGRREGKRAENGPQRYDLLGMMITYIRGGNGTAARHWLLILVAHSVLACNLVAPMYACECVRGFMQLPAGREKREDLNGRALESYRQREIKVRDYTLSGDSIPSCTFSVISRHSSVFSASIPHWNSSACVFFLWLIAVVFFPCVSEGQASPTHSHTHAHSWRNVLCSS